MDRSKRTKKSAASSRQRKAQTASDISGLPALELSVHDIAALHEMIAQVLHIRRYSAFLHAGDLLWHAEGIRLGILFTRLSRFLYREGAFFLLDYEPALICDTLAFYAATLERLTSPSYERDDLLAAVRTLREAIEKVFLPGPECRN